MKQKYKEVWFNMNLRGLKI